MKPGLVFMSDYFLLGPSVWGILKEKFGHDGYEIGRSCCNATNHADEDGIIAVAMLPGEGQNAASSHDNNSETIPVPPEGRFKYERVLPGMVQHAAAAACDSDDDASVLDDSRGGNVVSGAAHI